VKLPLLLAAVASFVLFAFEPALAQLGDHDGDGVPDSSDNCPVWPNPDQSDGDQNSIGDGCECGDQDLNGRVDVADLVAINLAVFNPSLATPLCDTNEDGSCDVADIVGANARIFGRPAHCSRNPALSPIDADGDGLSPAQGDCDDADASVYPGALVVTGSPGPAQDLAQGVCWNRRVPRGVSGLAFGDGCSSPGIEGLDSNNPAGCAGSAFGSGDPLAPLPCDLHDACYSTCGTSRTECDEDFLANMLAICDSLPASDAQCLIECRLYAQAYYSAVVAAGGPAYLNDQRLGCICPCDPGVDPSACGDGTCNIEGGESTGNCASDCSGALPGGALCVVDDDCASGICGPSASCTQCGNGLCESGESCLANSTASCQADCGACENGKGCTGASEDCASGSCNELLTCEAKRENGSACLLDSACASGVCNFAICVARNSLADLVPCSQDAACQSGFCSQDQVCSSCGNGSCVLPELCGDSNSGLECNRDCGLCGNGTPCLSNSTCASGVCNLGVCVARNSLPALTPCSQDVACRSGDCGALGTCVARCGDGFCDGGELCGDENAGLECTRDCNRCGTGTPCLSNSTCASGICNYGFCISGCQANGVPCTTTAACCSGHCRALCSPF